MNLRSSLRRLFQGYFQSLYACIERFLGFLNVKNLVLPAADEAESLWINKFGFSKLPPEEVYINLHNRKLRVMKQKSMEWCVDKLVYFC